MKLRMAAASLAGICAIAFGACGGGGDTGSDGDVGAFCDQVQVLQSLGSIFQNVQAGDIEAAKKAFQTAVDDVQKADDVAPAGVKDDVDAVLATFKKLSSALQDANSPADLLQALKDIQPDLQALQSHTADLQAFAQQNCSG